MARSHSNNKSSKKSSSKSDSRKNSQKSSSGSKSASRTIGNLTICGSVKRIGHPSAKSGSGSTGSGSQSGSGGQSGDGGKSSSSDNTIGKLRIGNKEIDIKNPFKSGGQSGQNGGSQTDSSNDGGEDDSIGTLRIGNTETKIKNPFKSRWKGPSSGQKDGSSAPQAAGSRGIDDNADQAGSRDAEQESPAENGDAGGFRRNAALAKQLEDRATLLEALAEANGIVMMGDPTQENMEIAAASLREAQAARAMADMHKRLGTVQNFKFSTYPERFERAGSSLSDSEAHKIFAETQSWPALKAKYADDPATMAGLWAYRKKYVDTLINGMREQYPTLVVSAAGSTDLTSDYDLTLAVVGNPAASVQVVEKLNEAIRKEFGAESGTVFDTNFYLSNYNSSPIKDNVYKDGFVPEGANLPTQAEVDALAVPPVTGPGTSATVATMNRDQDVLALMKLRRYADDGTWETFQKGTLKQMESDGASRESVAETRKRFEEADARIRDLEAVTDKKILELGGDPSKDPHSLSPADQQKAEDTRLKANNLLYLDRLNQVAAAEQKEQDLITAFASAESEKERQRIWEEINATRAELYGLKGESLYFAAEAYHSAGAVIHVVEGLQGGGKINAPLEQLLQSYNEQFGDLVKDAGHYDDDAEFFYRAAKYAGRMGVAMRDYFMKANGIQPDQLKAAGMTVDDIMTGTSHLSKSDLEALEQAGIKVPLAFRLTPDQKQKYQMLELMTNNTSKYLLAIRKGISKDSGPNTKDWYTRLTAEQKKFWAARYVDMFAGVKSKKELVTMLSDLGQGFNAAARDFNNKTYDARRPADIKMPPPPQRERGEMKLQKDDKHQQQKFVARARGSTN